MKKKLAMLLAGVAVASMALAGCSGSKGLETDELKISVYKGVEIDEVAKPGEVTDEDVEFAVEGSRDAQITIQLENDTDYEVYVDGAAVGSMKTNMSGKLSVSLELEEGVSVQVKAVKRA